jgi:hypothetical protein
MTIAGHDVIDIFIDCLPIIMLACLLVWFIQRQRRGPHVQFQNDILEASRRQAEATERIATILEKRS